MKDESVLAEFDAAVTAVNAKKASEESRKTLHQTLCREAFAPLADAVVKVLREREIVLCGDYGRKVLLKVVDHRGGKEPATVLISFFVDPWADPPVAQANILSAYAAIGLGNRISPEILIVEARVCELNEVKFVGFIERRYPYKNSSDQEFSDWKSAYQWIIKVLAERLWRAK